MNVINITITLRSNENATVLLVQNSVAPTAYSVDKAIYSRLRLTLHDVCGQQTTCKTQKQDK